MARQATKAAQNVYCQARLEAAKWNEKLLTRAGAVDYLPGVTEDSLKKYELGITRVPPDVVLLMADAYNAPQLPNYHCLNGCLLGCKRSLSDDVLGIDRVTVKLLKSLKADELAGIKDKLLDIAADGVISEDELPDLKEVLDYLDGLARTVSELKIIGEKALKGGTGNG